MKIPTGFLWLGYASPGLAALCGTACDLYSLQWQREFEETAVDTSTWWFRTDAKALSTQLAANVAQTGGNLVINLKKQSAGGFSYTGGGVISKPNFHYGYFESQMKLNNGTGWHSSFWLMAGNGSTTLNTAFATHSEIDVFERDSISNSALSHNINLWNADGTRSTSFGSGLQSSTNDYRDWHVYGCLWTERYAVFYIDGVLRSNLTFLPSTWTHDYLNIWLTSIAYQNTPDDSQLPSQVLASYVRYYQKDYYLTAGNLCFSTSQGSTPCPSNQNYAETGSSWGASTLAGYTKGLATRYSCNVSGAKATWTIPAFKAAGTYEVWAWIMARTDSDPAVSYVVRKASATVHSATVDQTVGSARWVQLAQGLSIAQGDNWSVTLTGSGSGCARADTIKFVRTS